MHTRVGPQFLPPSRSQVRKTSKPTAAPPSTPPPSTNTKPVSKEEIRGLKGRVETSVADSGSLMSTQIRERQARFQKARTKEIKPSHSRHLRKDIRARKQAGVHYWEEDAGLRIRGATPTKPSAAIDPAEGPTKARVAASFAAVLEELGFDGFVSGGAALAWHGGGRPIDDLDFRIRREDNGIGNFEDPQGRALLAALDDHNRALRTRGFDVGEWRALGGGGLTIVCDDYCGVELSISLTNKEQATLRLDPEMEVVGALTCSEDPRDLAAMHPDTTDVPALDLPELQADKLKSMISRWKWGEDNIKKTSQDLYDLLNAIVLDDTTTLPEAIDRAIDARVDEYKTSNPFHTRLDHVDDGVLKQEMLAFAVLMAKEHTRGKRKSAFRKLCSADRAHGKDVQRALWALAERRPEPSALSAVRPWIAEWRDREGPTGKRMPADMPKIQLQRGVDEILDAGVFDVDIDTGRAPHDQAMQVLTVLIDGDGFRPLDDSRNGFQTQLAFGLSPNQFSKVYAALHRAGYVQGRDDGLHLTPAGRDLCDL